MTVPSRSDAVPFKPLALAASNVGTWDYDVVRDRLRVDEAAASLFGLSAVERKEGVPIERINAVLHPADRSRGREERVRAIRSGGVFVMEYRVQVTRGDVRWVLARGRYDADHAGRVVRGRGVVVDTTESKRDGFLEGQANFVAPRSHEASEGTLARLADQALDLHATLEAMSPDSALGVRPFVNALLREIGFALASELRRSAMAN